MEENGWVELLHSGATADEGDLFEFVRYSYKVDTQVSFSSSNNNSHLFHHTLVPLHSPQKKHAPLYGNFIIGPFTANFSPTFNSCIYLDATPFSYFFTNNVNTPGSSD